MLRVVGGQGPRAVSGCCGLLGKICRGLSVDICCGLWVDGARGLLEKNMPWVIGGYMLRVVSGCRGLFGKICCGLLWIHAVGCQDVLCGYEPPSCPRMLSIDHGRGIQ